MIVSAAHKRLVLPYRADVAGMIPHALVANINGARSLVVPHTPDETLLLRNLGIDAPAPILHQYDWSGGTPFSVQRRTAAMMTTHRRSYVLNDMGTGKTRTTLWAFDYLRGIGKAKRMLVVAPISTLNIVWVAEIAKCFPHLSVQVLYGPKDKRLKRLAQPADVYVVNHHGLRVLQEDLEARQDIDVIAIDELAVLRNSQSELNRIARKLCSTRGWVWGLTGSPTPNSPEDAFGQTLIVTPGTAGKSLTRFREHTMVKVSDFRWIPRHDATSRVAAVFTPSVRFSLNDVVELPDLSVVYRDVPLSPKADDVYQKLKKSMVAHMQSGTITPMNEAALLNKLLQVSCGYVYLPDGATAELDPDPRLEVVDEIASAAPNHKLIVFAPFVNAAHGIAKYLNGKGHDTVTVLGETPSGKRGEIFRAFQQDTTPHVLVAHPGVAAHGLTLTASSTILWYGPVWSLELFEQANRRITRIGQNLKQMIIMLQGSPAEARAYKRLVEKQKMQGMVLDLLQTT